MAALYTGLKNGGELYTPAYRPYFEAVRENLKKRVVVGMSGGVDSSLAAALLQEQGFEVIGITLKLWPQNCSARAEDKCCGPQAVTDARAVCDKLGLPFYVADEVETFQHEVIHYFATEYQAGRTPNPCILCNEKIKFGVLLKRAKLLGARYIATGHYARVEMHPESARRLLKRGQDPVKDQSYFLFSLNQEQLAHTLFPLGHLTKEETRERARQLGLKTAEKKESMEICFVPDNNYGKFLIDVAGITPHKGELVDTHGKVLGYHQGIEFFTIGQRKRLGISSPRPLYVLALDGERNRVVLGEEKELATHSFLVERCNWIALAEPPEEFEALVRIRYKHQGCRARIKVQGNGQAQVLPLEPQRAVTPGQACVFYQDDQVLGGGWIQKPASPEWPAIPL